MSPEDMLKILDEHGGDAEADYNDSEEVSGWFGWSITHVIRGPVLTINHIDDTAAVGKTTNRWLLVPLVGPPAPASDR